MKATPLIVFNYSIKNQAGSKAEIFIDGDIVDAPTQEILKDWFGDDTSVSYKSFRDLVNASDAQIFDVYINSGGGQMIEAMAIHDLLVEMQEKKGKTVNTIGRGIVASAATYILMAGKKPAMSSNSWLMIHNVSGGIYGSVNEVENYAATMRRFNDSATGFYQKVTGLSKTVIANMMDAETWMTAEEAKTKGFIKETTGEASFSQIIKPEQWPFSNSAVLNSYNSFTKKNDPVMDTTKITEAINNGFNSLLEKLGISNKKDEAETKKAFEDFSNSITNAIAANTGSSLDEEAVKKIVNTALTDALKTIPQNFTQAIADSQKDFVKKEDIKDLVKKDDVKDVLNKTDFNAEMKTLREDLVQKISGGKTENNAGNKNKSGVNSKWAYENLWTEPAAN